MLTHFFWLLEDLWVGVAYQPLCYQTIPVMLKGGLVDLPFNRSVPVLDQPTYFLEIYCCQGSLVGWFLEANGPNCTTKIKRRQVIGRSALIKNEGTEYTAY